MFRNHVGCVTVGRQRISGSLGDHWLPVHGHNALYSGRVFVLSLKTVAIGCAVSFQLGEVKEVVQMVICVDHGGQSQWPNEPKFTRLADAASSECCPETSSSVNLDQMRYHERVGVSLQVEAAVSTMMRCTSWLHLLDHCWARRSGNHTKPKHDRRPAGRREGGRSQSHRQRMQLYVLDLDLPTKPLRVRSDRPGPAAIVHEWSWGTQA